MKNGNLVEKKCLAKVMDIEDPSNLCRIRASIIGLTDDLAKDYLPWAVPMDFDNIVPPLHTEEKPSYVWIYVKKWQDTEDWDYTNQRYKKTSAGTYKEVYDYTNSDSYKIKDDTKISDVDPALPSAPTYPENRVIKISNITIEFDETNKRYEITDEQGNYIRLDPNGTIFKSIKEKHIIAKSDFYLYSDSKFNVTTKQSDLKEILDDIQTLLANILTPGNWVGNMGAPVIYSQVGTDKPKAETLATKIGGLLK